jgi:hypothetical protein
VQAKREQQQPKRMQQHPPRNAALEQRRKRHQVAFPSRGRWTMALAENIGCPGGHRRIGAVACKLLRLCQRRKVQRVQGVARPGATDTPFLFSRSTAFTEKTAEAWASIAAFGEREHARFGGRRKKYRGGFERRRFARAASHVTEPALRLRPCDPCARGSPNPHALKHE